MRAEPSPTFGVRARLLLAFMAITSLVLLSAAAGIFALSRVGASFRVVTEVRVPQALGLFELAQQAEGVVRAAPRLLAAADEDIRAEVWTEIKARAAELERRLDDTTGHAAADDTTWLTLRSAVRQLTEDLSGLDELVRQRNAARERKAALLRHLAQVNTVALRLTMPGERVLRSQLAEWNRAELDRSGAQSVEDRLAAAAAILERVPQQAAGALIESVDHALMRIADAGQEAEIDVLSFPLQRSLSDLSALAQRAPEAIRDRLQQQVLAFEALASGPGSIDTARRDELRLVAKAEDGLAGIAQVSAALTSIVQGLVSDANGSVLDARIRAAHLQTLTQAALVGLGVLSLLGSGLIVWLYVGRNLIARLRALSTSMRAIAGGDLRSELPPAASNDEIGLMAQALVVFRDTAVEVERSNLHEIDLARRRLADAIENSAEGFAFFNAEDRLVICNGRYRELVAGGSGNAIVEGVAFAEVARIAAENGLDAAATGRTDAWIAQWIEEHRQPGRARLIQGRGKGWVLVNERKTGDGGTVCIYSDVSELKQREEEIIRKSAALERVSSQLAKYVSPQLYVSIFEGQKNVEIASRRKRLTVFFSDLVGFTETTERLESEDLTRLLNQYLTEMSTIAQTYGATVDKFMGDAILIFFGDPGTQGVKEDALACVKMAIAMRKRMRELQEVWLASGLETPLRCRTGINTGICTVGNFGSIDRMEYTIIGGGVNLAARLETACDPNEILISYETYAHVRDEVLCEERGQISVKGISHPVTTYRVVDLYDELKQGSRRLQTRQPHFRLEADLGQMTAAEKQVAAEAAENLAARLRAEAR